MNKKITSVWRDTRTPLTRPWDTILGTSSLVSVLRALLAAREPMSLRELARRAGQHLRSVQIAVKRLEQAGLIEFVGTGVRPQVGLVERHPLLAPLEDLFQAERERLDRIEEALREALRPMATKLDAAWIEVPEQIEDSPASSLTLGILASSAEIGKLADVVREAIEPISRREDVVMDVMPWTRPDLAGAAGADRQAVLRGWPLLGTPPSVFLAEDQATARRTRRTTHADRDRMMQSRMSELTELLRRRPELVREAHAEVRARLASAPAPEARTWREWSHILSTRRASQLTSWLTSDREDAVRLRQSLPTTFVRALRQSERESLGEDAP